MFLYISGNVRTARQPEQSNYTIPERASGRSGCSDVRSILRGRDISRLERREDTSVQSRRIEQFGSMVRDRDAEEEA